MCWLNSGTTPSSVSVHDIAKHGPYLVHRRAGAAEYGVHRCHAATGQTTGHNQVEVIQVGRDIEREPVHGYPPGYPDPDCTYLEVADPHARRSFVTTCLNAEVGERLDDTGFEQSHIPSQPQSKCIEVQNGIGDQLPRTVVCNVAASVRLADRHTRGSQFLSRGPKV